MFDYKAVAKEILIYLITKFTNSKLRNDSPFYVYYAHFNTNITV